MYKVKVTHPEKIPHQVTPDGYLKFYETNEPYLYSRGQAIKKANWFGGKIEKVETVPITEFYGMIISANDLLFEIRELMKMQVDFIIKEKNINIFKSDVFVNIRQELETLGRDNKDFKPKAEIITQLVQLSQVCTSEYVLVKDMCFN